MQNVCFEKLATAFDTDAQKISNIPVFNPLS